MNPRISVIIPVYNHEKELRDCLKSLEQQTLQDFEVIVVDDGSDKAVSFELLAFSFPISNISFEQNKGAPAARNAGFRASKGEYVVFLDADAVLKPDALGKLLHELEKSGADFAYSSFYWGKKKFPSRAFDAKALEEENYIHTSALMRRDAFPGFDEALKKLQDWDLFLTMARQGKRGAWVDEALFTIKPRTTGMSQWAPAPLYDIPWKWLGWTPKRLQKYFEARTAIETKHGLAPKDDSVAKQIMIWLSLIIAFEAVSMSVVFFPLMNGAVAILLALAMLFVSWKHPAIGLTLLLTELIIGGKGELFKLGADGENNGGLSIRMLFFAAFLVGWAAQEKWGDVLKSAKRYVKGRTPYLALFAVLLWAFARGYYRDNPFLFQDANAWGFLLLLLPALRLADKRGSELLLHAKSAILAALAYVSLKTIFLFYLFSHPFGPWVESVYYWIRKSGVGEITRILENAPAHRIFFQSHIYEVLALAPILVLIFYNGRKASWWRLLFMLCFAVTLISFSRSFWIGALASFVIIKLFIFFYKEKVIGWARLGKTSIALTFGTFAIVIGALLFPLPWPGNLDLSDTFIARFNSEESALRSRWQLLPALWDGVLESPIFGHGFGSTVTYRSEDPRVVAATGGEYTTYAFEWGWLDFWYKFGILGIPVLLWILGSLVWRFHRLSWPAPYRFAVASIIATLAVVHVFTPYLNHPLGLSVLIILEGLLAREKRGA